METSCEKFMFLHAFIKKIKKYDTDKSDFKKIRDREFCNLATRWRSAGHVRKVQKTNEFLVRWRPLYQVCEMMNITKDPLLSDHATRCYQCKIN